MAIQFNEIGDHYRVTAPAARTFPASDWVIALWTRIDENSGEAYKYALSNGAWGENGSIQIYLNESSAGFSNKWTVRVIDDTGKSALFRSGSSPGADLRNRLILLQRNTSSDRFEFWFCEYGMEPVLEATVNASSLGASTGPKDLWIGGRADGNADRFFGGTLGEVFRGDFALSAEQIKALGMGLPPWALGRKLDFYLPLSDARPVQRDHFGTNDAVATKPGVSSVHFPLATRPGSAAKSAPHAPPVDADLLVDLSNVSTAILPTWNDSEGTAYLEDGNGNKRAISWSPNGYAVSTNGEIGNDDRYPIIVDDPPHTPGTVYYVSSSLGSDTYDGLSPTHKGGTNGPFKTVTKVNGLTLSPGDEVLFRRGDTWINYELKPPSHGSGGNYIKYGAYGTGSDPLFDGNNLRKYLFYCLKTYIWVDGLDFYNGDGHETYGQVLINNAATGFTFTNCTVRNSNKTGMASFAANTTVTNCLFKDNYLWGFKFSGGKGEMRNQTIGYCTFTGNAAGKYPAGKTVEPCVGIKTNDRAFGNLFYNNYTTDHLLYRGWSGNENDASQGLCRIHDNSFDCTSGTVSSLSLGCKGRGARVFRNKLYKTGSGITVQIASAPDGGTPYNKSYCHHNLMVGMNPGGEGGAMTLSALTYKEPNGRGEVHYWNNTVDDCGRGGIITDNAMPTDNTTFKMHNNLISNNDKSAFEIRTDVETREFNHNYYYKNSDFRSSNVYKTNMQWNGLVYDLNSVMSGADPKYQDGTNASLTARNYGLKEDSPARSEHAIFAGKNDVPLVATDTAAWIGINYVPQATTPDAGAYQYLSGKTLDFSRYFAGFQCKSNLAKRFRLWRTSKDDNSLRALTST